MSVERLALLCKGWSAINPGGHPPRYDETIHVSPEQLAGGLACETYIQGVEDGQIEDTFGSHYHPVPSRLEEMKTLIETFLKYANDHPEKQDFAASTALGEVMKILAKGQTEH